VGENLSDDDRVLDGGDHRSLFELVWGALPTSAMSVTTPSARARGLQHNQCCAR
jgi:hypothetical protein